MILMIEGHDFHYEMENLCRLFFPYEKIHTTRNLEETGNPQVYTGVFVRKEDVLLRVWVKIGEDKKTAEQVAPCSMLELDKECERLLAVLLFGLFVQMCDLRPPWGILTGVRPVKLLRRLIADMGREEAIQYYREGLLVTEEKMKKSLQTMENEQKILSRSRPESFSLYLSIPFCPTRCAYCSFVSQSVVNAARLIPEYVELLCGEVKRTGQIARELGLRLESVYVGGGTPTTLTADQLRKVLSTVREGFDLSCCREFTVEAGRPDTITGEKLEALREMGVSRISINPQTLNDDVLRAIGRRHSTAQTLEAFALAREKGFCNINMDVIVGLPQDTPASFRNTLEGILQLGPESITVHALSLKRSSRINQSGVGFETEDRAAFQMLEYGDERLFQNGYLPYYLYRQSRMVGNLENTGWAKPGFESDYNVYIMDETHTILACGAGAVSKVKDPNSDRLERIFNFKFPYEYVSRYQEMITRKERVKELYGQFRE